MIEKKNELVKNSVRTSFRLLSSSKCHLRYMLVMPSLHKIAQDRTTFRHFEKKTSASSLNGPFQQYQQMWHTLQLRKGGWLGGGEGKECGKGKNQDALPSGKKGRKGKKQNALPSLITQIKQHNIISVNFCCHVITT